MQQRKMTIEKTIDGLFIEVDTETKQIAICGDWNSNFGRYYESAFERYKAHSKGQQNEWNRPQVIGMDWDFGLTHNVTLWLYHLIDSNKV